MQTGSRHQSGRRRRRDEDNQQVNELSEKESLIHGCLYPQPPQDASAFEWNLLVKLVWNKVGQWTEEELKQVDWKFR